MNFYDSFFIPVGEHSRVSLGAWGENVARNLLVRSGYAVQPSPYGYPGDLLVKHRLTGELIILEVKTARRCSDGKYRFTLWKDGHTDHRKADAVILLPVLESGRVVPFVIPVSFLAVYSQVSITSHPESYSGKLARFRQSTDGLCLEGVLWR